MFVERLTLSNFRCFGPEPQSVELHSGVTAFVGMNRSGKTALMQALSRLFGVTAEQRRLRRKDFHIPAAEIDAPGERTLFIEGKRSTNSVLAFALRSVSLA
jgi:predicted ATP-dependent endonuclease of OLD family